jgi:hypothetical protein
MMKHFDYQKVRSELYTPDIVNLIAIIHESYEHMVPRSKVILQLHRDLYSYNPTSVGGRYKNVDNVIEVVDKQGQKRVRFYHCRHLNRLMRWNDYVMSFYWHWRLI